MEDKKKASQEKKSNSITTKLNRLGKHAAFAVNPEFHKIRREIYAKESSKKTEDILDIEEKKAQKEKSRDVALLSDYKEKRERIMNLTKDPELLATNKERVKKREEKWNNASTSHGGTVSQIAAPAASAAIGGAIGTTAGPIGSAVGAAVGVGVGLAAGQAVDSSIQHLAVNKGIPHHKAWKQAGEIMKSEKTVRQHKDEIELPLSLKIKESLEGIKAQDKEIILTDKEYEKEPKTHLESAIENLERLIQDIERDENMMKDLEKKNHQSPNDKELLEKTKTQLRQHAKEAIKETDLADLAIKEIKFQQHQALYRTSNQNKETSQDQKTDQTVEANKKNKAIATKKESVNNNPKVTSGKKELKSHPLEGEIKSQSLEAMTATQNKAPQLKNTKTISNQPVNNQKKPKSNSSKIRL